MDENIKLINETQTDNVVVRSFIHTNDRKQTDERIVTDVKKILAGINGKIAERGGEIWTGYTPGSL